MALGSIVKGGLGLAGGLLGDRERRKGLSSAQRAAEFKPWDVNSPLFGATFDRENNTVNTTVSEPLQGIMDQLFGSISGNLNTDPQHFYNLLSQLSESGERRQMHSLENRLFSQGRLGSTGGALQLQAGMDSMNDAMLKRELGSYELQNNLFNQALGGLSQLLNINQAALAPAGMGSGIGLNNAQIGASLSPSIMGVANSRGGMWESLFGGLGSSGLGSALGGLFG